MESRIKCGKCGCEFSPSFKDERGEIKRDATCPQCGFGGVKESMKESKSVLLD